MRKWWILLAYCLLAWSSIAYAGPAEDFADSVTAYERQDYATALRLLLPLADQGDASAQNNLGLMYDYGHGVPQDYVQAHKWGNLAASKLSGTDGAQAVKNRDIVAAKMTPAQIAEAQKLARERKPR